MANAGGKTTGMPAGQGSGQGGKKKGAAKKVGNKNRSGRKALYWSSGRAPVNTLKRILRGSAKAALAWADKHGAYGELRSALKEAPGLATRRRATTPALDKFMKSSGLL